MGLGLGLGLGIGLGLASLLRASPTMVGTHSIAHGGSRRAWLGVGVGVGVGEG